MLGASQRNISIPVPCPGPYCSTSTVFVALEGTKKIYYLYLFSYIFILEPILTVQVFSSAEPGSYYANINLDTYAVKVTPQAFDFWMPLNFYNLNSSSVLINQQQQEMLNYGLSVLDLDTLQTTNISDTIYQSYFLGNTEVGQTLYYCGA